jgi:hypothetical protein
LNYRAQMVIDSLKKANFDTTALATVQRELNQAKGTVNAAGQAGRGGGGGGGAGFGGGRGGAVGFSSCEHPMTQWDTFCARPTEIPFVSGGGRGGGGGGGGAPAAAATTAADSAAARAAGGGRAGRGGGRGGRGGAASSGDIDPVNRVWGIIGMPRPAGAGGGRGGGGGGGRGGFGGGASAGTGDYLVTLTIGGQTYKQTFHVESPGVSGATSPFGGSAPASKNK